MLIRQGSLKSLVLSLVFDEIDVDSGEFELVGTEEQREAQSHPDWCDGQKEDCTEHIESEREFI